MQMAKDTNSPIQRIGSDPQLAFAEAVIRARADKRKVRVRVDLRLYNATKQNYFNWPDSSYILDVEPSARHGEQLRRAFDMFTKALTEIGPESVMQRLSGVSA
jgi:hypothetical protein